MTTISAAPSSIRSWWLTSILTPTRRKLLAIGPDRAGNLLEVVVLTLASDRLLVIHAMPLRRKYRRLLPGHRDE